MRRRVIGATLTILGVLILLFEPVGATGYCADFTDRAGVCRERSVRTAGGV